MGELKEDCCNLNKMKGLQQEGRAARGAATAGASTIINLRTKCQVQNEDKNNNAMRLRK